MKELKNDTYSGKKQYAKEDNSFLRSFLHSFIRFSFILYYI